MFNYADHQGMLVDIENGLSDAEGGLARFYGNNDLAEGHAVLVSLREAADTIATLIEQIDTKVTEADAADLGIAGDPEEDR